MSSKSFSIFFICFLIMTGVNATLDDNKEVTFLETFEICIHMCIFIWAYGFPAFIAFMFLALILTTLINVLDYNEDSKYNKRDALWGARISTALIIYDY